MTGIVSISVWAVSAGREVWDAFPGRILVNEAA